MNVNGISSALRRGTSHYTRSPSGRLSYAAGRGAWRSFSHKVARDRRLVELEAARRAN
ncbi:hypothetical protein [Burkholderia contaminans]|uniref:hypothetical protein n=1 Tax=Burkholderia contaminans TaxID=488447 RepID=UPI0024161B92|nr:hypothetical protein [Burkholderia contaminans]WFN11537.1 hypothetical protein LXE92_09320 [Burkholderia contaminans]